MGIVDEKGYIMMVLKKQKEFANFAPLFAVNQLKIVFNPLN